MREHGSVDSSGQVRGSPVIMELADITGGRGEADKWGQVRWERAARVRTSPQGESTLLLG